jgi:hypothetical protein
MDPNKAIRPWLLAVGATFGCREAHDTHWNDADTHPSKKYFEYTVTKARNTEVGKRDLSTKSGNDVTFSACQEHEVKVMIDLYRDEDGIDNLARCNIAATHNQLIRNNFDVHGVSYARLEGEIERVGPRNIDTTDDFPWFHHQMTVVFRENIEYEIEQVNAAVNTILLQLESDSLQYQINDSGVTIVP